MPSASPSLSKASAARLADLGAGIRGHRMALGLSATATAAPAGLSRITLFRIERGEPSVTIGAYLAVMAAIGLELTARVPGTGPQAEPG